MRMITLIVSSGIAKKWYSGKNRRCVPYDCVTSAIGRTLLVPMRIARPSMHSSPPLRDWRHRDPHLGGLSAGERIRKLWVGRVLDRMDFVAVVAAGKDGRISERAGRVRKPHQERQRTVSFRAEHVH